MANLNKVMLIGNLTRNPETRHTPKGTAVSEISLAINRVWRDERDQKQEEVTFVDVTLWGRQAELAQQYLAKGRPVYIEGRLQLDSWEDKTTGQKRSKMKIIGEVMQFLGSGNSGGSSGGGQRQQTSSQSPAASAGQRTSRVDDFQEDDDIPF